MNLNELPKTVISLVSDFPNELGNKLLKMALLAHQPSTYDSSKIIENFTCDTNLSKGQIYEFLGVYIALVQLFLENGDIEFNSRLLEFGFTKEFVENLPFLGNRDDIMNNLYSSVRKSCGRLSFLKWRIDISLSNSALMKKVPTSVIISMTLSNGRKYTIEIEAKVFHKLRFNIALILKELNALKSNYSNKYG